MDFRVIKLYIGYGTKCKLYTNGLMTLTTYQERAFISG